VQFVKRYLNDLNHRLEVNIIFVHGDVLIKVDPLDLLNARSLNSITLRLRRKRNVLFVTRFSFLKRRHKSIVLENVLKLLIERTCVVRKTLLILTEEEKREGVIVVLIGNGLDSEFLNVIIGYVNYVEKFAMTEIHTHTIL